MGSGHNRRRIFFTNFSLPSTLDHPAGQFPLCCAQGGPYVLEPFMSLFGAQGVFWRPETP